ncbi:unnamed protein product [Dicrocoelium dendriticum]|nr:unnamed protein product [Dicrocoelium dendriticum]
MVLKRLDNNIEVLNDAEQLGDEMIRIGTELGDDAYGTLLKRCGEAERTIGTAISDFRRRVEDGYLGALRSYSHNCAKSALKECEKLEDLRLDLDRAKTLLKRSKDDASKKQKYEQQVSEAQTAYTRQVDITKRHLEQSIADFGKLRDSLIEFMKSEREYYEQCLRAVNEALQ